MPAWRVIVNNCGVSEMTPNPTRRLKAVQKIYAPEPQTHVLWWDESETLAEVRERARHMIAKGKASESDEFVFVSWDVPRAGEDAKGG
jgi:hypothetical protein